MTYKNTFAPHLGNEEFTLNQIIGGLNLKAIQYDTLPDDIRRDVDSFLEHGSNQTLGSAGEDDHWITLEGGQHILVGKDETAKEAIDRHFSGKTKDRTPNKVWKNEKIEVSSYRTAEHLTTGEHIHEKFGMDEKLATEQARKADGLRAAHEPIAQKYVNEMTKQFPEAQVSGRVKDRSQMVGKLARKPDKYKDVSQLNDVSGVRVISGKGVDDVHKIGSEIESKYNVIEKENYIDNPNLGYRSLHYMLQDKETGLKSEVQVRTVNEDKWATYAHDRVYKATGRDREILDAHATEVNNYMEGMSNYYYAIDSGKSAGKRPPCPEAIQRLVGCL